MGYGRKREHPEEAHTVTKRMYKFLTARHEVRIEPGSEVIISRDKTLNIETTVPYPKTVLWWNRPFAQPVAFPGFPYTWH